MKFPIQSSRFVPWSSRKAPGKVSGSSCSSAMDSLPFPPARPRRQPRLQALLSRCSCASGKVQMLIFFFYELAEPSAVPPALAEEAAAPRTASAGAPGGLAGHERELQGQAGVALGWMQPREGLGADPGFFPPPSPVSVCVGCPGKLCPLQMGFDLGCHPGVLCWGR